jgi:hypothetical protein
VIVPTDVNDDAVTPELSVAPVKVPAAAVTVPEDPRLMDVPLTVTALLARYALAIAEPFQVPAVIVPTEVKDEPVTLEFRVAPVRVPAAAVTVPKLPRLIEVPLTVTALLVSPELGTVVLSAEAGIEMVVLDADVIRPYVSTAIVALVVALP